MWDGATRKRGVERFSKFRNKTRNCISRVFENGIFFAVSGTSAPRVRLNFNCHHIEAKNTVCPLIFITTALRRFAKPDCGVFLSLHNTHFAGNDCDRFIISNYRYKL